MTQQNDFSKGNIPRTITRLAIPMILAHAHAPEAAAALQAHLTSSLSNLPPIMQLEIGTVVGTHGGPGIVGLSWIE